jgi:hypothetical protein
MADVWRAVGVVDGSCEKHGRGNGIDQEQLWGEGSPEVIIFCREWNSNARGCPFGIRRERWYRREW